MLYYFNNLFVKNSMTLIITNYQYRHFTVFTNNTINPQNKIEWDSLKPCLKNVRKNTSIVS